MGTTRGSNIFVLQAPNVDLLHAFPLGCVLDLCGTSHRQIVELVAALHFYSPGQVQTVATQLITTSQLYLPNSKLEYSRVVGLLESAGVAAQVVNRVLAHLSFDDRLTSRLVSWRPRGEWVLRLREPLVLVVDARALGFNFTQLAEAFPTHPWAVLVGLRASSRVRRATKTALPSVRSKIRRR